MYDDLDGSHGSHGKSLVAVWTTPAGYIGGMEDGPTDWVLRCMVVTGEARFNVLGKTLLEHHNTYDQAKQLIDEHRGPIRELRRLWSDHGHPLLYNTIRDNDADFLYLFDPRPPYNCWTAAQMQGIEAREPFFRPLVAWVEESRIRPRYILGDPSIPPRPHSVPVDPSGVDHSVPVINQKTIDIHIADIVNIILPLLLRISNIKDMFDYVFVDNDAFSVATVHGLHIGHGLTHFPFERVLREKNVTWLRLILFEYRIVVFCQCSMADRVLGLIPSMIRKWLRGKSSETSETAKFFYDNALVVFTEWPLLIGRPRTQLYNKEFVITGAKKKHTEQAQQAQQAQQAKKRRISPGSRVWGSRGWFDSWQEWVEDELQGGYDEYHNMGWESTTTHYAAVRGSTAQNKQELFQRAIGSMAHSDIVSDILGYY